MAKRNWENFKNVFMARDAELGFINVRSTAADFVKSEEVKNRVCLNDIGVPAAVVGELRQSCNNGQKIFTGKGANAYRIYWPKEMLTPEVKKALKSALDRGELNEKAQTLGKAIGGHVRAEKNI